VVKVDRRALALIVVLAVPALAGCGGGSDSSKPSAQATKEALKPADINPTPRDQVRDGGTLRWAVDQFSTQWNYNELDGPADATLKVLQGLLPSPLLADEHAKFSVDPNYAISAKVTSTDPQVIDIKLNPKAKWSDGKPITVKDYEAQWKAMRGTDERYNIASSTGYERIESVKPGADEYEVVATFKKPFGEWQSLWQPLYPASTNATPEAFNKGWVNKIPITAGPFKLEKIDQTAKTVTIERDPNWWGPPAKLDKIITRALEVDATINAFANGEVDVADVGPDPSAYKRAVGVAGAKVRSAAGPDFRHFTFNGTSKALSDVNVRKAVAMAINREVITKADLTGLNWPAVTMGNHYFVNTQTGYRDNSGDVGRYDPEKAKALLEQAGWKMSGAYRQKDGKALSLRFVIPAGATTSKQEGELTQAMLKEVGIKVVIDVVPSDDFFDKYVTPGSFDITPFSWIGTPYPVSSAKSIYINPKKTSSGELDIQQNYARIGSPEIDKLMSDAEQETDPVRAAELANEADKAVWAEVHSLTLFQRPQITAVKGTLANVGSYGFKTPLYQDIGYVK
jgi:peptide/nickel transport system substrate-binding protein